MISFHKGSIAVFNKKRELNDSRGRSISEKWNRVEEESGRVLIYNA
jgi:hypothetical protein